MKKLECRNENGRFVRIHGSASGLYDGCRLVYGGLRTLMSLSFARERCLCCNRTCAGNPLCAGCLESRLGRFEVDFSRRCTVCGRELLSESGTCMKCRSENGFSHLDRVFPLFPYRLWIKRLIYQWKVGNRRSLSPVFADVMDAGLKRLSESEGPFVLVPVPPRPGKIRRKGWDQMDEVCRILGKCRGYPVLRLLRRFSVSQQKKLDRAGRLGARKSSYGRAGNFSSELDSWSLKFRGKKGFVPETAVIMDDVITTGATVDSCAEILRGMGISRVIALSLVIVD